MLTPGRVRDVLRGQPRRLVEKIDHGDLRAVPSLDGVTRYEIERGDET